MNEFLRTYICKKLKCENRSQVAEQRFVVIRQNETLTRKPKSKLTIANMAGNTTTVFRLAFINNVLNVSFDEKFFTMTKKDKFTLAIMMAMTQPASGFYSKSQEQEG